MPRWSARGRRAGWLVLAAAMACAGATPPGRTARREAAPRVILFVADGAGAAAWTAGYLAARGLGRTMAVARLPVSGLLEPGNTSRLRPESASSATAFATGVRSYYYAVGVGPDSLPRRTVLEAAEERGMATGVLTTTTVVDATPAAFVAHVRTRQELAAIADQMAAAPLEVLMGDGEGWFDGSLRPDRRNLLPMMGERATIVESGDELRALELGATDALVGFFPSDTLRDPARRDPSLTEMTRAALAILDRDPDGFFLMVENEHTDHSAHENRPQEVIAAEILSLDEAVAEALAYRERHPETLVVVLGDHETGGLSLVPVEGRLEGRYASEDHTLSLVPVFAAGPGAERFGGIHTNDEIGRLLLAAVVAAAD